MPARGTYCLVTDLAPGVGYAATASVSNGYLTLNVSAGGTFITTAQGTLALDTSVSGVITAP